MKLLLTMAELDQTIRKELGEAGWDKAPKELLDKVSEIDEKNTSKLKSMLSNRAWFSKAEVGIYAIGAAFLIIQHSLDNEFQERMLPVLKQTYLNGDGVSGQEVALLTDRVLIRKRQQQRFGKQADIRDGKVIFKSIDDPATVDERRAEMKMPPLEFYKKLLD